MYKNILIIFFSFFCQAYYLFGPGSIMQLINNIDNFKIKYKNPVITIGNFDGVHLGHQALLHEVIEKAEELNGTSMVMTFEPHPTRVLKPDYYLPLITLYEQKVELIEKSGKTISEPERTKRQSFCCGAGGGMLFTEELEGTRINHERVDELMKVDADEICISCPFCQMMISDGCGDKGIENASVRDIAQVLADCIE